MSDDVCLWWNSHSLSLLGHYLLYTIILMRVSSLDTSIFSALEVVMDMTHYINLRLLTYLLTSFNCTV